MVQRAGRHEKQARSPAEPRHRRAMTFDDLRPVFCDELVKQELNNDDR
jgi:hypothetical protein